MGEATSPKSIIVTGGASGIGLETVKTLAPSGAYITILDVNDSAGNEVVKEFQGRGHHVQFVKCDTTDYSSQVAGFKAAIEFSATNTLDVVIASAGKQDTSRIVKQLTAQPPSLDQDPPAPNLSVVDVNLTGLYYSTWLACYYFQINTPPSTEAEPLNKSIVLVSSFAGYIDFPDVPSPYWVSKWGVRGLFNSVRHDVKKVGARINLIAPYYVKTPLTAKFHHKETPGGWAKIEDVAEVIKKCATDTSVDGIAFGVFPPQIGTVDLGESLEGHWGGKKIAEINRILVSSGVKFPSGNPSQAQPSITT